MAGNLITIKSIMEELRGRSQDRNYGKDEHPAIKDEGARGEGKDSVKEMELTDNGTEVEKGQRRIRKKGKSNKITLIPNRPRVQVTPNEKTAGTPRKEQVQQRTTGGVLWIWNKGNRPGQAEKTINKDQTGGRIRRRLQQEGKIRR
jgi:hypothetical protein